MQLYERDVRLRLPFRFGVTTMTEAPQAFARVRVRLADGRELAQVAYARAIAAKLLEESLNTKFQAARDA